MIGYWLRRAYLNVKGFLAATLAIFLPGARPIFNKLIVGYLGKLAQVLNIWLAVEVDWSPVIAIAAGLVIAGLEQFALWRVPNETPTTFDKANPVVRTAVEIPPT